ncbi:phage tail tape measure C-terminal domain-containing protein [Maricaulis sp.]|uniref:phage tail tape measure C-terminal domain-containing protein n=1 Tax=Maricaulis sp. TaxID=1486257 RepID=UPI00262E135F|nr:phage tail tape measure C-terminal domain-containing protein [Maricaulis sp.]
MTDFTDDTARAGAALDALAGGPAQRASEAIEAAFERTGESIERALGRAARAGEADFARMTEAILRDLARLAAEQVIAGPLEGVIGRALSGPDLFGARAEGGPVTPGGAYLVGERGPEIFTPASAGEVGPAGVRNVTINLTLPPGTPLRAVEQSETRIARTLARAVARGSRWS